MTVPPTDRQPILWNVLQEARELSACAETQREDDNAPYLDTVDRLSTHVPALLAEIDRLNADAKLGSAIANNMVRNNNDLHEHVGDLQGQLDQVRALVVDLVDDGMCRFDHHGYCQEHGWFETEPACPHGRAKALGLGGEATDGN